MPRLSWNQIKLNAATFAEEWKDASYERGETQTFYNEFFEMFGVKRRKVASFEEPIKKLGDRRGFLDLFWKGVLLVEQKSAGLNLAKAKQQALDYFPAISWFVTFKGSSYTILTKATTLLSTLPISPIM